MKLHIPISNLGRKVKIEPDLPVLFLAGPVRNAPKWHEEVIRMLLDKSVFIASPTRSLSPDLLNLCEKDGDYDEFPRQRAWEQFYLDCAAVDGCIAFWLPKESNRLKIQYVRQQVEDKVYAHITMMELGQWIVRKSMFPHINVVVGTDGEFPEISTILFELESLAPTIPICRSLSELVETSVNLLKEKT